MSDRSDYEIQTNTQRISGINAETEAGKTGRPFSFECKTNVTVGGWFNTSKSYLDLDATGACTGLMSAHNKELRMPVTPPAAGHYTVSEHELVFQASTTGGRDVSMMWFQVSGDGTAQAHYLDNGYFFEMTGFGTGTDGDLVSSGTAEAMTESIRINIDGIGVRYLMVCTNPATA